MNLSESDCVLFKFYFVVNALDCGNVTFLYQVHRLIKQVTRKVMSFFSRCLDQIIYIKNDFFRKALKSDELISTTRTAATRLASK